MAINSCRCSMPTTMSVFCRSIYMTRRPATASYHPAAGQTPTAPWQAAGAAHWQHWPDTPIRGDSHYGRRARGDGLVRAERRPLHPRSVDQRGSRRSGLAKTDAVCVRRRAVGNLDVVRDLATRYAAKSWRHARRAVARIEATRKGLDVRHVATNITQALPRALTAPIVPVARRRTQASQEPIT